MDHFEWERELNCHNSDPDSVGQYDSHMAVMFLFPFIGDVVLMLLHKFVTVRLDLELWH